MKTVGFIPCRGNSKGIKDKNLIMLNGKPLITYAINTAIQAALDEVWVSTDSTRIAEVAEANGAKILMRPDELATDEASSELALLHFVENVKSDIVAFMQCTSPLLSAGDIQIALNMLKDYDSIFSGYEQHWLPKWHTYGKDKYIKTFAESGWNRNARPRRQDRNFQIVENGALYISPTDLILKNKCRYSGNIGTYIMPVSLSTQIDNLDDLFIIESIMKNRGI